MSDDARTPWLSVALAAALATAVSLGMIACGSSGARSTAGGNATCRVGEPVGAVVRGLPRCAAREPANTVFGYTCRTGDFFIVYEATSQLYGRPGGRWATAAAGVPFATLRARLGC